MDIRYLGGHSMTPKGIVDRDRSAVTHAPKARRTQGRIRSSMFAIPRIKEIYLLSFIGLIAAAGIASAPALAQETFPSRPMKVITPLAAGSASDIALRFLADRLSL